MSITSFGFLFFCLTLITCYFLLPKRVQWIVLLVFSTVFYAFAGVKGSIYILVTSFSAWLAAIEIEKTGSNIKEYIKSHKAELSQEEKSALKAKGNRKKRIIMMGTLCLNFGILCVFKYANFAIEQLNGIMSFLKLSGGFDSLSLMVPLGISFYTFQTMGYLVDVYWEKTEACKNPFRLLLFTSFFPQITQGSINNYSRLSEQLFAPHSFDSLQWTLGAQRMIWGFFKKLAVADLLAPFVSAVFTGYNEYSGPTVLCGAFFYSIQIYADFSGYMDIVCGLCQIIGIKLTENFMRPYFSKSIAEYWRRWHISLGDWFKTYIYYPIAVSKWNMALSKRVRNRLGKGFSKNLSATIALVAVWLTTGLWHGASWAYVAWGGVNGIFIIFSMWMEPVYDRAKTILKIREQAFLFRAFQVARTFILVTFIKVLPEVGSLGAGIGLWRQALTEHTLPGSLTELLPFAKQVPLIIIAFGTLLMLAVSLIQRKRPVRLLFLKLPSYVRIFFLALIVTVTLTAAFYNGNDPGGFMYAQF